MFKKSAPKAKGFRKKTDDEDAAEGERATIIKATAGGGRKRGAAFSTRDDDGDDDDGLVNKGTAVFESSRSVAPIKHRGGAFQTLDIDTDEGSDARAILERRLKMQEEGTTNDETKLYAGAAGYKQYTKLTDEAIRSNKYTGTKGPIRAPQFVRNTCRFDYQPDVCKDYKDTGFCGYGDSCKFMHDRGQYKTGWQLEAEHKFAKERQKEREMAGKLQGDDSDEERERDKFRVRGADADDLPFACHICRGPFKDPMKTTCDHYFCANCANDRFRRKSTRCVVCDKQTYGVLNAAPRLIAKAKAAGGFQAFFESSLTVDDEPFEDTQAYKSGKKNAAGGDDAALDSQRPSKNDGERSAPPSAKFAPSKKPKIDGEWSHVSFS